ncbi:MAG TPA: helix-turn-helix domain-containing protein [Acidimicrobiales bacterium]|nr:helix-turn-helix domain-containing protein [Acidimicrobiales bacterium]
MIRHVVAAMSKGLAVTVAPQTMALSTQQAADLLGVSRPTLVRHLESGDIPFERVGSHRRLRLTDVLAYRERRRENQYAFLAETSVAIDDEDDLAESLEQLREIRRRQQASRRKTPRSPDGSGS